MAKNRNAAAASAASQAWQGASPWLAGLVLGGGTAAGLEAVGAERWLAAPMLSVVAVLLGMLGFALVRGRGQPRGDALVDRISGEIDHIMIGAAETSFFVDTIKSKISKDVGAADRIAASAEQNAATTEQIAANAERASAIAAEVRTESVSGRAEVDRGLQQIGQARTDALSASSMMAQLQEKSRRIHGITEVISEIAARTNLLALNAAIEAARAGEQGRGFAVVAGEVRQLAQRTKEATDDIGVMVRAITEEAERAASGMNSLSTRVLEAAQNVEKVHALLNSIERSSSQSQEQIEEIAVASREHVQTTQEIAEAITDIRNGMLQTDGELPRVAASAMQLSERAEAVFEAIIDGGARSGHDEIREAATEAAHAVGRLFEDAIRSGQIAEAALFDRSYKPIANTSPQKHSSQFDGFTDRVLPPLQEALLERMPQLAYAGAVDNNGYFPTHNKKFSQPLTGNYDVDLVNNRTKRIFSDRTGKRCGANTKPFLLQTYKRDTGEVMHDLSVPIYVNGKHWGGFRVGYRSSHAAAPGTAPITTAPAVELPASTSACGPGRLPAAPRGARPVRISKV
ncbi:MAG TPA: methyl-accepting chemotaxis protein [Herbaspirillum sp.]|uniref:methyl-accepting chemotaxis protein n=1 Tax=Herbaspirillum sp. TaxID=1890675 RepID=UPI002D2C061B|nr:methyl-accepting chemotaxis protein [Herbaspirillum sp.]HZG21298.1 methyl-accepting chemotaxis protein [Herbaspirillum sp.]